MSCSIDRFVITKGVENNFVFTIKADGSTLPLVIENTDTFDYQLVKLEDEVVVDSGSLTVENAINGKVGLTLSQATVDALESEKGTKADRYYLRPTYKLMLLCNTVNNGNFLAKVSEVYVD
jgi:hypothetical protein